MYNTHMRFLCIDSHAILHRAYHALPPLTTPEGKPIQAAYGYTSMILRMIHELKPTHIAATFDRPKPTFRKKLYAGYQAHRPAMADDLPGQIDITHDILRTMTIPIFEVDGYEADDVMGTIATRSMNSGSRIEENKEIIIVTGDRDLLQLVTENIKVYMPVKGLSEGKLYGEKDVEERLGILPSQVIDYKAIVGDASDNYPGIVGIGPKTAIGLLKQFQNLDGIYHHLDEIKSERAKTLLKEKKGDALLSQQLATVVCDVPMDFSIEQCKVPFLNTPVTQEIFQRLGFRSLLSRLSMTQETRDTDQEKRGEQEKEGKKNKQDIPEQTTLDVLPISSELRPR